jgi:hypothetical protein
MCIHTHRHAHMYTNMIIINNNHDDDKGLKDISVC